MRKNIGFLLGGSTWNGRGAPTLIPCNIFISLPKLKIMKIEISGSVYRNNGAGLGLSMQDGRMVNNRPDGMTGIQQLSMARKTMKNESKVQMAAEGYARGERMSEMNEMMSSGCSCGKPNCNC